MPLQSFLIAHGWLLILPMAVIEGPIVSVAAGFLSSRGYFDWYWVLVLLVAGDVIGDVLYYAIGRASAGKLAGIARFLGVRDTLSPDLRRDLTENSDKMLLVGKWTHAIGFVVLTGSGMLRLPLGRFIAVNLLASIPKSAALMGLGYFVGGEFPFFADHFVLTMCVLAVAGLAAAALILRRGGRIWASR